MDAGVAAPAGGGDPPLRVGDMVWGKVKSHPWWPGHIYDDSFVHPSVSRSRHDPSHFLVAFYGDSSYGWFDPGELLPFAPHYSSKSVQTSNRPFLRAVEEATDETSRRAALSISCRCRNPSNFRSSGIPGYSLVDVPGYEPGALYSSRQIEEARELFVPEGVLGFLKDLAVVPNGDDDDDDDDRQRDVGFIQNMAIAMAYRKARYEEFDTTYAEAFGVEPVRATRPEAKDFAQRAVPLSGQLKIAEALGGKKHAGKLLPPPPATSAAPPPASSSSFPKPAAGPKISLVPKKNKVLLLKRRDAAGPEPSDGGVIAAEGSGGHRVLLHPGVGPQLAFPAATAAGGGDMGDFDNFVLQRRPAPAVAADFQKAEGSAAVGAPLKKKVRKREEEGTEVMMRKKKKAAAAAAAEAVAPPLRRGFLPEHETPRRVAIPLPKLELDAIDIPAVVDGLRAMAWDPNSGAGGDVSGFILTRRAFVYQKSMHNAPEPAAGDEAGEPKPKKFGSMNALKAKEFAPAAAASKEQKLKMRPKTEGAVAADAGNRKRGPSDRQEELAVKKQKKIDKIKTMSMEKKAAAAAQGANAPQQAVTKPKPKQKLKQKQAAAGREQPQPGPMVPSPTALLMKFPANSTMPSVASLKARFGRFGTLEVDGIRVFWKSYTCKVVFKFRADAETAMNSAIDNSFFGKIEVDFSLKAVAAAAPPTNDSPPRSRFSMPENSAVLLAPVRPSLAQPLVQPKSILKKSGDDAAAAARADSPRVKFALDGGSNGAGGARGNGGGIASLSTAGGIMRTAKSVNFRAATEQPVPQPAAAAQQRPRLFEMAPPPPRVFNMPPPPQGPRVFDMPPQGPRGIFNMAPPPQQSRFPPPPPIQRSGRPLDPRLALGAAMQQQQRFNGIMRRAADIAGGSSSNGKKRDISFDMIRLLLKCSDMIKSDAALGNMPFRVL